MRRLFVAADSDRDAARRARAEGWATIDALGVAADAGREARRLRCSHRLEGDKIVPV